MVQGEGPGILTKMNEKSCLQGMTEVCVIGSMNGNGRTSDVSQVLILAGAGSWGHVALDKEIDRVTEAWISK